MKSKENSFVILFLMLFITNNECLKIKNKIIQDEFDVNGNAARGKY